MLLTKVGVGVLRQYAAAVSAALSVFIVGNWIAWPSSAVKKILSHETSLQIDAASVSWAVALLDFGNVLSALPSSFLCNSFGRKRTIISLSFVLFSTWLLAIFGTNEYYLYVARTIVGICKGIAFTAVPVYLGEIASTAVRGGVGTIFCAMMNCGILFELCIGPLVSYNTLNILSSPIPILFFLSFLSLPESPHFLLMKGRAKEAQKSLAWFRNKDQDAQSLEQELKRISSSVEEDMKQKSNIKDLLSSESARRAMLISMGFAFLQRMSGVNSIISYSTVTLPSEGGYFSAEAYMFFFGVTMIIGPTICVALVDRLGRKPLMIISCFGCGLSTGITGLFYWLSGMYDLSSYNWVPYFCLIMYGIMFSIGLGTIPSVIVVELFTSDMRSYASSVAAIFYALGSFITNKLYLYIKLTIGVHYMFLLFTVSAITCAIFTCAIFFETSGLTFLEIQTSLKREPSREESKDTEKV